jgi:hypothetical protein
MKKAQGLSLQFIIIAAISIMVLIVVLIFFTGKMGESSGAISDCQSKGGELVSEASECEGGVPTPVGSGDNKQYCCIKLTNS